MGKGALEDLVLPANVQNVSVCVFLCVCVEEVRGGQSKVSYMQKSALFPPRTDSHLCNWILLENDLFASATCATTEVSVSEKG